MRLVIMAARNRTKLFNLLQAGNVPADGTDWFRVSKMRRRFGAVFMSGVDGLNVPAQPCSKAHPMKCFAMVIQPQVRNLHLGHAICNRQICESSTREQAIYGPEFSSTRTPLSNTSR